MGVTTKKPRTYRLACLLQDDDLDVHANYGIVVLTRLDARRLLGFRELFARHRRPVVCSVLTEGQLETFSDLHGGIPHEDWTDGRKIFGNTPVATTDEINIVRHGGVVFEAHNCNDGFKMYSVQLPWSVLVKIAEGKSPELMKAKKVPRAK